MDDGRWKWWTGDDGRQRWWTVAWGSQWMAALLGAEVWWVFVEMLLVPRALRV